MSERHQSELQMFYEHLYEQKYVVNSCVTDKCVIYTWISDKYGTDIICMSQKCVNDICVSDKSIIDNCFRDKCGPDTCMSEQSVMDIFVSDNGVMNISVSNKCFMDICVSNKCFMDIFVICKCVNQGLFCHDQVSSGKIFDFFNLGRMLPLVLDTLKPRTEKKN
jgi:hypothetical protein